MPRSFARRQFLATSVAGSAAAILSSLYARPARAAETISTGLEIAEFAPFDRLMKSFMTENAVPGAALAVTKEGRLVYARGFGMANVVTQRAVEPQTPFRIASVSKPFTAVRILQLVEQEKFSLRDKVVDLMAISQESRERIVDARWLEITVKQCLQHTGGWDREISGDAIAEPWRIAKHFQMNPPVAPNLIITDMLERPLDFKPGERYAYSNLGYLILGRIIEQVTKTQYDADVKAHILSPLGIKKMQLGRAVPRNRMPDEAFYYDSQHRTGRCLYPEHFEKQVPLPDGAENFEAFTAHGGWVASVIDLVRFATAFDRPDHSKILSPEAIRTMYSRPAGRAGHEPNGAPMATYYGCGWSVRPIGDLGRINSWHSGQIAGTSSLLVRRQDGLNWAVVFNSDSNPAGKGLAGLIDGPLHQAANAVTRWPTTDQFSKFLS